MKNDLFIPKVNSNDDAVKITSWLVSHKEHVAVGQPIITIETTKTNIDIMSEFSGYVFQHHQCGDSLLVGDCYATICETLEGLQEVEIVSSQKIKNCANNSSTYDKGKLSKSASRYIEENKLNPEDFMDLGLVTVEKIKSKLAGRSSALSDIDKSIFPQCSVEQVSFSKLSEIDILNKGKADLIPSSLTIQFNSDEIRKNLLCISWLNGRISTYILYIFCQMLSSYPKFTAYYKDGHIFLYNRINLGVAIDLEKGLKVAVIKDANTLSLFDLHMSIIDCIGQYYEDNLSVSSLSHSTVTTTDLSNDGILHFQPVLNTNQSIIMGIGGDQSLAGSPLTLTIVFDHRVLTGQEVATFLKNFKDKILKEHKEITTSLMEI